MTAPDSGRAMPYSPLEMQRFMKYVEVSAEGCWIWYGGKKPSGYGVFKILKSSHQAHRASYAIFCGEIPAGSLILHSCNNPSCVFPGHLRIGTVAENWRDMESAGRASYQRYPDKWLATCLHMNAVRKPATGERNGAYTKPHRVRRGELNGRSKLTAQDISEIRASTLPSKLLALRYPVSATRINQIRRRAGWRHV